MPKAKQNKKQIIPNEILANKIYNIRGMKVMLDRDLAALYEVETRVFNQAVKRNIERFPEDFMFQLNKKEFENWKSQIVISNSEKMGLRKLPYAFTEQGIAMLSGVINSEKAIAMNIAIMRAFVEMRRMALNNKLIADKLILIENKIGSHDEQLKQIYEAIENLLDEKVEQKSWNSRKRIGFRPDE
jgi:hypothetical protein